MRRLASARTRRQRLRHHRGRAERVLWPHGHWHASTAVCTWSCSHAAAPWPPSDRAALLRLRRDAAERPARRPSTRHVAALPGTRDPQPGAAIRRWPAILARMPPISVRSVVAHSARVATRLSERQLPLRKTVFTDHHSKSDMSPASPARAANASPLLCSAARSLRPALLPLNAAPTARDVRQQRLHETLPSKIAVRRHHAWHSSPRLATRLHQT